MNVTVQMVEDKVKQVLVQVLRHSVDPSEIRSDVALVRSGLSLDSVTLLECVVGIEGEFDILLDGDDLSIEHFESLGALSRFVHREVERQKKTA